MSAADSNPAASANGHTPAKEQTESYHAGGAGGHVEDPTPLHCSACPSELSGHPRYQILGLLGAGGMGCVYKARHQFMDRLVAIKMINRELLDRPPMVARFLQEVKGAARLTHPNIVQAYDADQVGDTHFLVMEFVAGVNLDEIVARQGPLAITRACGYARQVALGLQHAYERGMVHRDIKPHNLMLTGEEMIKILDFGLARYVSEVVGPTLAPPPGLPAAGPSLSAGTAELAANANTVPARPKPGDRDFVYTYPGLGTPDYIAPEEILDARRADIRADIYSLGCTLYRFLTGQVPFPAPTALEKLRSHLERVPEPLRALRPELPPELAGFVHSMMAKEPQERVQTPAEVARALAPFTEARRRHLLIVDDEPDSRESLALALGLEGYQVSTAANGLEALARLRLLPRPDLILLDMAMPVMDGYEFLYALKKEPDLGGIPIVVLSGTAPAHSRAVVLGIADYLQKPFPVEDLSLRIKQHTR